MGAKEKRNRYLSIISFVVRKSCSRINSIIRKLKEESNFFTQNYSPLTFIIYKFMGERIV